MIDALVVLALGLGTLFMLIASLGMLRLGNFYLRIHASTKAATLGLALLLAGAVLAQREQASVAKALLVLVFLGATAPVGAHILARAAYRTRSPLPPDNAVDEYAGFDANRPTAKPPEELG